MKGKDTLKSFSLSRVQSLDHSPKGFSLGIRIELSLGGGAFYAVFQPKKKDKENGFLVEFGKCLLSNRFKAAYWAAIGLSVNKDESLLSQMGICYE